MRLINEKKIVERFGLKRPFENTLLYVNMKNKNIACTDFVIVNIALNLHSYEENKSFILEFMKKMYLLLLFKS